MIDAGISKTFADILVGHSIQGIDKHYIKPKESTLIAEMDKYTKWLEKKYKVLTKWLTTRQKREPNFSIQP